MRPDYICSRQNRTSRLAPGFTIVELLIVIVVIAILATITIVAYNGIQQRAQASSAQGGLDQVNRKLALYLVDNGAYPADSAALNALTGDTGATTYQYTANNATTPPTYCLTSTNGTTSYYSSSTNTNPISGSCVTNLATNPSLETNSNSWNGWAAGGSYTLQRPTTGGHSGTAFHRALWSVASTSGGGVNYLIPATAGTTYTTSMWVRPSKSITLYGNWQNGGTSCGSFPVVANVWSRISCTGVAPVGFSTIQFNAYGFSAVAGDYLDGDDVMITVGTTSYNYADGSSPGWVWNGTANASTSTGPPL